MPNNFKDRVPRRWKNHLSEAKDHYRVSLNWDRLRKGMAQAVEAAREGRRIERRLWEHDWSKGHERK